MLHIFFQFLETVYQKSCTLTPRYNAIPTLPDILPPPLGVPGNLWAEIPYYTVYRFNPTLDIRPQIAVNKQWRFVEVGQLMLLAVDFYL